jgi:hypothetical protein
MLQVDPRRKRAVSLFSRLKSHMITLPRTGHFVKLDEDVLQGF